MTIIFQNSNVEYTVFIIIIIITIIIIIIIIIIALKLLIQLKAISTDLSSPAVTSTMGNAKAEPSAVAPPAAVAAATAGSSSSSSSSSYNNSSSIAITTKQQDIIIAENADVSKTGEKHAGNVTYYEHSINYKIPQTVRPGKYNVVFYDKSTNTQLDIPIEIRSAAIPNTPKSGTGSSSGESINGDTRNMFAASGIKTVASPSSLSFFYVFIAAGTAASALV